MNKNSYQKPSMRVLRIKETLMQTASRTDNRSMNIGGTVTDGNAGVYSKKGSIWDGGDK